MTRSRLSNRAELLLALFPTLIVLVMLWLLEMLINQWLLFASLASSAFRSVSTRPTAPTAPGRSSSAK